MSRLIIVHINIIFCESINFPSDVILKGKGKDKRKKGYL